MNRKGRDTLRYEYAVRLPQIEQPITLGRGEEALESGMFKALEAKAAIIERVEYIIAENSTDPKPVFCQIASYDNGFGFWASIMNCLRAERAVIVQTIDLMYEQGLLDYPMPYYYEGHKPATAWLELAATY